MGEGEELFQSGSIVRFLARKVGLAGKDDLEFAQADIIYEHCGDLLTKMATNRWVKEEQERISKGAVILKDVMGWLENAEKLLKKRGGVWFAGNGLTYGDIAMEVILFFLMAPEEKAFIGMDNAVERSKILDGFPLLKANNLRVREVPEIANWINNRPPFSGL